MTDVFPPKSHICHFRYKSNLKVLHWLSQSTLLMQGPHIMYNTNARYWFFGEFATQLDSSCCQKMFKLNIYIRVVDYVARPKFVLNNFGRYNIYINLVYQPLYGGGFQLDFSNHCIYMQPQRENLQKRQHFFHFTHCHKIRSDKNTVPRKKG